MRAKGIDRGSLQIWENTLSTDRPGSPDVVGGQKLPEITSFSVTAAPDGIAVRMATRADRPIDLKLNPVVACHFAAAIVQAGIDSGWLDDEGNIIIAAILGG